MAGLPRGSRARQPLEGGRGAPQRSRALWEETESFALISDRHPLADADRIDPRDLADLPLHLPSKADNPDVYHLVLELLADAGVPSPRRAPSVGTLANVVAHVAGGNGWMVSTRSLARHVAAGIVPRRLAVTARHTVRFVVAWHVAPVAVRVEPVPGDASCNCPVAWFPMLRWSRSTPPTGPLPTCCCDSRSG